MACTHERWEKIAAADGGDPGGCPICMSEEIERLRGTLREAIELAEEGWSYTMQFIKDKWRFDERLAALKESHGA